MFEQHGSSCDRTIFSIYTDSSASQALFTGALVTGPKTATYKVDALEPGTYFFRCDVHPTTMTGTFIVK